MNHGPNIVICFVLLSILGSFLVACPNVKKQFFGMVAFTISNVLAMYYFNSVCSAFLCIQFTVFLMTSLLGIYWRRNAFRADVQ